MAKGKKFTAPWIPSAPPGEHFDAATKGLGLRVSPKGTRTFFLRAHLKNGTQVRRKLGTYPKMSLSQARSAADIKWGEFKAGTLEAEEKVGKKAPLLFREAGKRALGEVLVLNTRERTIGEYRRIFEHDLLPAWGDRPVNSITRSDVAALAAKVAARGSPVMANRTLGFTRLLWNAMLDIEVVGVNPAAKPKRFMRPERPRERALSKAELKAVMKAARVEGPEMRAFAGLVLYTAQRAGAVALAEWTEFDLEGRVWRVPATEGRKFRGHDRLVPLNDGALRSIRILGEELKPHSVYLFPSRSGAKAPTFRGWHNLVRRLRKRAGVEDWSVHAFRISFRTTATGELGIRPDIADLVLGHAVQGVGFTHYQSDKVEYLLREKRQALDAWSGFLRRLERKDS